MEFMHILGLGAVAGFTIYLGFPLVFVSRKGWIRAFLNAISVGVLLFLFVEMSYIMIEAIEQRLKLSTLGLNTSNDLWGVIGIFVSGLLVSLLGLVWYETHFIRHEEGDRTQKFDPRKLAMLIAVGIGLHNFSEGLVIGQEFLGGAIALGYTLVVGFALHNATEGFGIAAPMSGERPDWKYIFWLGLIGGGPTLVGTVVGSFYFSEYLSFFFMALASGAILYIVGELIHLGKLKAQHLATTTGLLAGFFLAFGSDLLIERAQTLSAIHSTQKEVQVSLVDFQFVPNQVKIPAHTPVRLVVQNDGSVQHEMEILGLPEPMEAELTPHQKTILLLPGLAAGTYPFICNMPGHLMAGMKGEILVTSQILSTKP